jgi:hypothetical protein
MEKILQINCNATDFYQPNSFPTFLYYNPYDSSKSVCFSNTNESRVDLYDVLQRDYLAKEVNGEACFEIPASSSRLVVVLPSGSQVGLKEGNYMVGSKVIAYHQEVN